MIQSVTIKFDLSSYNRFQSEMQVFKKQIITMREVAVQLLCSAGLSFAENESLSSFSVSGSSTPSIHPDTGSNFNLDSYILVNPRWLQSCFWDSNLYGGLQLTLNSGEVLESALVSPISCSFLFSFSILFIGKYSSSILALLL